MSEFNISSWLKDQYLNEAGLGSTKSQKLAKAIHSSLNNDLGEEGTSYTEFADAVASVLINEYGTDILTPFMEVLHARLGMNESLNESKYDTEETIQQTIDRLKARIKDPKDGGNVPFLVQKIKALEKSLNEATFKKGDDLAREIDSRFGGNPYIDMVGEDRGTITFRMKGEFPDSKWNEILNLVKSKGFEITSDSNYYDIEPGEREWFPKIDFKLK